MISPVAAVESHVYDDPDVVPQSFRCLGVRSWERGAIVIYHVVVAQTQGPLAGQRLRMLMCQILERDPSSPDGWRPAGGGGFDDDPDDRRPSATMLLYAYGMRPSFAMVYGCRLTPQIHAVEVAFANGDIRRDSATDDVFAVLSPHPTRARELRALTRDGRIVCRYSL